MRKLLLLTITFGLIATATSRVEADLSETTEARYLAGLRERRLYALVEAYCTRRLDEAYLVERRRAELTVELSRTALEAALFAKSPEREELAARATAIIDAELRNKPSSAWRPLLDVQRGLVDLVWGERLREEAQLLSDGEPQLEQARERLRAAVTQLKQARATVDERLRDAQRSRPGVNSDVPDADDWYSVRRNVDYQLGRALRNQGESYPPRSADRLSALEQAVETFEVLTRAQQTDPITWQARLEEVACKRLLGDLMSAEKILDLVDQEVPPADVADRARAQRIRIRIAAARLDEARKFLKTEDTEPASNVDADVRLAALEWLIASAAAEEKAGHTKEAADYRARVELLTRLIAERQAPYWARRAESLAASAVTTSPTAQPDGSLTAAAATFYRQNNFDKALEIYDQLFAQAWSKRQQDAAFEAAFTAGAIEQQRKKYGAAAQRYAKLAQTITDHPRAAEAQLLAAYNVGQTLLTARPEELEAGLADYGRQLETQLKQWPAAKETAQARVWLGRLRTQQRAWDAAAQALAGIAADSPLALEAVQQLGEARGAQLAALRATGQPTGPKFVEVERELTPYLPGYPQPAMITGPVARYAAATLAKLGLVYGESNYPPRALALLTAASAGADLPAVAPPSSEKVTIDLWRAAALVATGRSADAVAIAGQLTAAPERDAAAVVALLDAAQPQEAAKVDPAAAEIVLKLTAIIRTQRPSLVGPEWLPVVRAEARALDILNRAAEARRAYDGLAQSFPQDFAAQLAYAEFLSKQADRESLALAAAKWRSVERGSAESSPQWYRARLGVAEASEKLGDRARAKQLVELTQALHPNLGGPKLKPKFEALLERVKNAK